MRKIKIMVLCSLLCVLLFAQSAFAIGESTLTFWFSDSDKIAYWDSTVYIYCTIAGGFYFNDIYAYARQKWSNAGMPTSFTNSSSNANILVFAGTETLIEALSGIDIGPYETGLTVGASTHMYYATYGSYSKSVRKQLAQQKILIPHRNRTENEYKKTTMHELGHALGWMGHSSNEADIMWSGASSLTSLSNRDIKQIIQLYTDEEE